MNSQLENTTANSATEKKYFLDSKCFVRACYIIQIPVFIMATIMLKYSSISSSNIVFNLVRVPSILMNIIMLLYFTIGEFNQLGEKGSEYEGPSRTYIVKVLANLACICAWAFIPGLFLN